MTKHELIVVEFRDGTVCRMAQKAVELFLARNKISRIRRSGDWVTIGKIPPEELNLSNSNI